MAVTRVALPPTGLEPPLDETEAALQDAVRRFAIKIESARALAHRVYYYTGGNGLTREYPVERLLRDARASMNEDGCKYLLGIKGGTVLVDGDNLGR